ncbi:tetraacyldisaccharide 4'-kinase [Costertonia aggregata]|uniref:Tetraacyldisaccharide 4'-kinase n=1 Tax=Costertonia aggregata TaxID=343403 RepID=A0A7H9ALF4_9FLAO|nr:tetraacyldisaccharide 4'-kinase [Costertonia aggregata]QLG44300.1 tetraacyldisaccharide 4'-kinase [Costertonia aggregata]
MWLLRKILFPVSLVYMAVVYLRNYLYDIGLFKSKSYQIPILCVGNLSTGGTGKTPMVEYLVSMLKDDFRVGVLSRGYRRKSKGFVLANKNSSVEDLGDEPYQIYSKYPMISLAVDANRQNGISHLKEIHEPDIIILDDAFQHRKVKPGFLILLTSYGDLYSSDWYLPTGNLRDSKKEAKRADVIIVTKCPKDLSETERERIIGQLGPISHQKVLFSYLNYHAKVISKDTVYELDDFKDTNITLVTGIANPKPLLDYLKGKNISFEHLAYKDHHFFTEKELGLFNSKKCILTTEKDYVRLKGRLDTIFYIPISHQFIGEGKKVLQENVQKFMRPNR